jgi:RsiW-degrading membrane proteinase PrsW (M82 family)
MISQIILTSCCVAFLLLVAYVLFVAQPRFTPLLAGALSNILATIFSTGLFFALAFLLFGSSDAMRQNFELQTPLAATFSLYIRRAAVALEELCKLAAIYGIVRFTAKRHIDIIPASVLVGLGFATLENASSIYTTVVQIGSAGKLQASSLLVPLTERIPPTLMHGLTSLMFGRLLFGSSKRPKIIWAIVFFAAFTFHSAYNYLASMYLTTDDAITRFSYQWAPTLILISCATFWLTFYFANKEQKNLNSHDPELSS